MGELLDQTGEETPLMIVSMTTIRRFAPLLLLAAACADRPEIEIAFDDVLCRSDARGGLAVRDSAGIEIVENGAPARGASVRVSEEPAVTIGAVEGEDAYLLGQIAGATRLPDGRIVIADRQSLDLRVFEAQGRFLNRFGGSGEGPGEHQRIERIFRRADTLIVLDNRARRLTYALPDGTVADVSLLEMIPFSYVSETGRTISGGSLPSVRGILNDGSLLATQSVRRGQTSIETRISRGELMIRRIDPHSGAGDSLGIFQTTEDFMYLHPDGSFTFGDAPFGKPGLIAISGDRYYTGDGEAFEIEEHAADGRLTRLIRVCELPDAVTEEAYETYVLDVTEPYEGRSLELELTAHRGLPRPDFAAPYADLRVDGAGRLWIRDFAFIGAPQTWRVLDTQGRWLGDAILPNGIDVLEIGDDYLLGRVLDAFDVESVQLYDVRVDR